MKNLNFIKKSLLLLICFIFAVQLQAFSFKEFRKELKKRNIAEIVVDFNAVEEFVKSKAQESKIVTEETIANMVEVGEFLKEEFRPPIIEVEEKEEPERIRPLPKKKRKKKRKIRKVRKIKKPERIRPRVKETRLASLASQILKICKGETGRCDIVDSNGVKRTCWIDKLNGVYIIQLPCLDQVKWKEPYWPSTVCGFHSIENGKVMSVRKDIRKLLADLFSDRTKKNIYDAVKRHMEENKLQRMVMVHGGVLLDSLDERTTCRRNIKSQGSDFFISVVDHWDTMKKWEDLVKHTEASFGPTDKAIFKEVPTPQTEDELKFICGNAYENFKGLKVPKYLDPRIRFKNLKQPEMIVFNLGDHIITIRLESSPKAILFTDSHAGEAIPYHKGVLKKVGQEFGMFKERIEPKFEFPSKKVVRKKKKVVRKKKIIKKKKKPVKKKVIKKKKRL